MMKFPRIRISLAMFVLVCGFAGATLGTLGTHWYYAHEEARINSFWNGRGADSYCRRGQLEALFFDERHFDATDLLELRNYQHSLTILRLPSCVTDDDIHRLPSLGRLETLAMCSADISDDGVRETISKCPALHVLMLRGVHITNDGLQDLLALPNLRDLLLRECPDIDDRGIASLTAIQSLETLFVSDMPISDNGFLPLQSLPKLRSLSVYETSITKAGIAAFEKARPDVTVEQ